MKLSRKVALLGSCTLLFGFAPYATAQTATSDAAENGGGQIEEIIVTAQKRAENVQNVPIAISAFGSKTLQERAVSSVSALSGLAPNVNLDGGSNFSASTAVISATIRGIGSDDFAFNIDPGVGIYLDGVYLARTIGANQDLPDVERIEILKGPQGTLFGRNTIGGAISIVTHEPAKEFKGRVDVTTGSYNLVKVRGTIDIPLSSSLFSSVTFATTNRGGYLKRIPFGDPNGANSNDFTQFKQSAYDTSGKEGGDNTQTLRGKLKWDNGGSISATLTGDWTHQDNAGGAEKLVHVYNNLPGPFAPTNPLPGTAINPINPVGGFNFAGLYNFCISSSAAQIAARNAQALCGVRGTQYAPGLQLSPLASVNVDGNPFNDRIPFDNRFVIADPDLSYSTGMSFAKLNAWGLAGTVQAEVSDALTVKSITAYRKTSWRSGQDADGSPLNIHELSFAQNQWQFSQELQLQGNLFSDKLKYVLGAYYFKEKGDLHDYVTFSEGLLSIDGPNTFNTQNYAFFGQVDYKFNDLISFTGGGRYTRETKLFEGGQHDLNGLNYKLFGCSDANGNIAPNGDFPLAPPVGAGGPTCLQAMAFPDPADPTRFYVPGVNRKTFSNFSPKLGIQVHPSQDVMLYGSWSKGYKTGGWTTRLTNPQGNVAPDFNEEKATTWEVGIKSTLLDRHLQVNFAAFSTLYKDLQLNIQVGTSPTIANAGVAQIRGLELEVVAAPVDGFTINASAGLIDAHYKSLDPATQVNGLPVPGLQAGVEVGGPLPKTPDFKMNIAPRYEYRLGNGGSLVLLADWTHTSSLWNDTARSLPLFRPKTDIVNASLTYTTVDEKWSVTVGGTNLTNKRYLVSGSQNPMAGIAWGSYNRPAEWYARLGFKF